MLDIKACSLLTAVSCDVSLAIAKSGDGKQTVVLAPSAAAVSGVVSEVLQFIRSLDGGNFTAVASFQRIQRAAVSSHDTCDIRAHNFTTQDLFDSSET